MGEARGVKTWRRRRWHGRCVYIAEAAVVRGREVGKRGATVRCDRDLQLAQCAERGEALLLRREHAPAATARDRLTLV